MNNCAIIKNKYSVYFMTNYRHIIFFIIETNSVKKIVNIGKDYLKI